MCVLKLNRNVNLMLVKHEPGELMMEPSEKLCCFIIISNIKSVQNEPISD